ncbi:uncharacterized protein J3R85_011269 [Psidium guajava]|nr:uncharacterized protein J3R85_011269 [Psidium guajava]
MKTLRQDLKVGISGYYTIGSFTLHNCVFSLLCLQKQAKARAINLIWQEARERYGPRATVRTQGRTLPVGKCCAKVGIACLVAVEKNGVEGALGVPPSLLAIWSWNLAPRFGDGLARKPPQARATRIS